MFCVFFLKKDSFVINVALLVKKSITRSIGTPKVVPTPVIDKEQPIANPLTPVTLFKTVI